MLSCGVAGVGVGVVCVVVGVVVVGVGVVFDDAGDVKLVVRDCWGWSGLEGARTWDDGSTDKKMRQFLKQSKTQSHSEKQLLHLDAITTQACAPTRCRNARVKSDKTTNAPTTSHRTPKM